MRATVVIPIYKDTLNPFEEISLQQVRKILYNYQIIFIAPKNVSFKYLNNNDIVIRFNPKYFISKYAYNELMLSPNFYKIFLESDYILIYQLDAFVFYDMLEYFCQLNYDYIGAPWPYMWIYSYNNQHIHVGNGGFSLRKVQSCYNILKQYNKQVEYYLNNHFNEDVFFSHCSMYNNFNVAPINIAYQFSMEFRPSRSIKKNKNILPFGCHGWYTYEPQFYAQLLKYYGYNFTNILNQLEDKCNIIYEWLINIVKQRIAVRIKNKQDIIHYLSTTNFNTIYIIGNNNLLSQLLVDRLNIEYIYKCNNINELTNINQFSLLLTDDNDILLIQQLQNKGYIYGKHFISFFYECIRYYKDKLNILSKKKVNSYETL